MGAFSVRSSRQRQSFGPVRHVRAVELILRQAAHRYGLGFVALLASLSPSGAPPEECASLVPNRWRYYAKSMKLRAMSKAFAFKFYRDRAMARSAAT